MQNLAVISDQVSAPPRPALCARISPAIHDFLNDGALVHALCDGFGSPLNVMFPQNIDDNIEDFKSAYKKHHLRGRIYFTTKPCKSKALLRHASLSDVGADVSSAGSLTHALSCGFAPSRIEATGPKNADYLLTCLQLDVMINADSVPELHLIQTLRNKLGLTRRARVMVRLSGFSSPRMRFTPQDNTFGIDIKDVPVTIDWLVQHKDEIEFHGFSFHMSGTGEAQRFVAIENLLELTFLAARKGLKPRAVNIGGGFSIQYADDAEEWAAYVESLKKSVLPGHESLSWNGGGLGFRDQGGIVTGAPMFIDHCPRRTKGGELDHWLSQRSPALNNATFADIIRDSMLELSIEPGRGMLDQCGITLGRVTSVKQSSWGETLVGLEMNRSNIHSSHMKLLTDPVIVPRHPGRNPANTKGVYYTGNLCVAYDMLQYNKTFPGILPAPGDIVAFNNTAAYLMDFIESETLMQKTAKKVAVWKDQGAFRWAEDSQYLPIRDM